jgi:hypothetical protein
MASLREIRRRSVIPIAGLAIAGYYLLIFVPLAHRSDSLDVPLQKAWQKLAGSLDQSNSLSIDFLQITNQLNETKQALLTLDNAKLTSAALLDPGPAVRSRMNGPFQLVDFENERSKQIDQIGTLAKKQQVTVDPAVFAEFPEHTIDLKQPTVLWPALALVDGLLATALQCKVAAIHSLELSPAVANPIAGSSGRLSEIPVQIELTGSADSITTFVQTLPLRAEEMRSSGFAEVPADKLPLFIERLLIKKQSADKTDEVRLRLRVVGFIMRE